MTEPTMPDREPSLGELMRRVAFDRARGAFITAANAAHDLFIAGGEEKAQVQAGLADVKQKVNELDPETTIGIMVFAVVQNPEDAQQLGIARHSIGTVAMLDSLPYLAHLIREEERAAENEVLNAAYPVCEGCGRRHPTGVH